MASSSRSMSSSISRSSKSKGWTYDVFLSFAGKDTRKGFVGHLYNALNDKGIYTFRDDLQLRMGDSFPTKLLKAIEESRIFVIVFSKKYADSSWCLDELVKIMDCTKLMGQMLIPVSYDVEAVNVRRQNGVFEEAFKKHEKRELNNLEKVRRWRQALFDTANFFGCDVTVAANGYEAESIKEIVNQISRKRQQSSGAAQNLVGIWSRVRRVKSMLVTAEDDVRVIGIWGMGGAGKTTLAWAVYQEVLNQFQGRSFVANIRECSEKEGVHSLQRKILYDLLSEEGIKVSDVHEGTNLMSTRLQRKKILLVLDDVDDVEQVYALGNKNWFGKGSRIIITTRDRQCLEIAKVDKIYKSIMLEREHALKLFSLYAFQESKPPQDFMEDSEWVINYADGLPLALKVLGSFLYGRNIIEWKSTLERLKVAPEDKVYEILKISYDGLRESEQKLFLDIACFFKGSEEFYATKVLDSFDFFAGIGIKVLIQKCLVSVSRGRLCMHDKIQEMGWHIIRKVSNKPGEHSRLWLTKDICHVMTSETGTGAIEGINLSFINDQERVARFYAITFKSINELRFLHVDLRSSKSRFPEETLPSKLQWLHWRGFPWESLPNGFLGEKLVGLDIPHSNVIQLWEGRKNMDNLKFLDLSYSSELTSTPDFTGIPNLESLILDYCYDLVEVHPSVGDHKHLRFLSLNYCRRLEILPYCLRMESLETLILSHCSNLRKFPNISENMGRLTELYLDNTSIRTLPKTIGNLNALVLLNLSKCEYLTCLPDTICELKCLETLDLTRCSCLKKLPKSLGQLETLEKLVLDWSSIKELPSSIEFLRKLRVLSLMGCTKLMHSLLDTKNSDTLAFGLEISLIQSLGSITKLTASHCNLSEGMVVGDFSFLFDLEELDLSGNLFNYLPYSISQLPQLKILNVSNCHSLKAMPALPSTISILVAKDCPRLTSFMDFTKYESLWNLSFHSEEGGWENSIDRVLKSLLQGHLTANHRFNIVVRGDTIPRWFKLTNEGNRVNLELPINWCNQNVLGFAFCAVFSTSPRYIFLQFGMTRGNGEDMRLSFPLGMTKEEARYRSRLPFHGDFKSRHVWLGFISFDFMKKLFPELKEDDWTRFQGNLCIELTDPLFLCETQECAASLVYKKDMTGEATFGLLDDSTGRPKLESYNDNDLEQWYFPLFDLEKRPLDVTFFKPKDRFRAEMNFRL